MIQYLTGDATYPAFKGIKIICHICNNVGKWGKGFVLSISQRWPIARVLYIEWSKKNNNKLPLGNVQIVHVDKNIYVANMISQNGIYSLRNRSPICYNSLRKCLQTVYQESNALNATIHMPKIGSGLAKGNWEIIESIIFDELSNKGVTVYIYEWGK